MPTLRLYYPPKNKRWEMEVEGPRFLIGRNREAEVCIPHSSVSKKHVQVEKHGAGYVYRDLGSKNGIFLNGFRVDKGELDDGDELRVGIVVITFYSEKPPAAPAAGQQTSPANDAPAPPLSIADLEKELDEPSADSTKGSTIRIPVQKAPAAAENPVAQKLPSPAPKRISSTAIAIGAASCVTIGLLLGYIGGRVDSGPKDAPAGGSTTTPRAIDAPRGGTASQARSAEPGAPGGAFGPLAALDDAETARRLCVRLYLDLVGRPPNRRELKAAASLPAEKLWYEVVSKAPPMPEPPPERLGETFERLMGRKPSADESAKLRESSHDDPAHYAFEIATSAAYSNASHRRKRSEPQLARSLLVDLTGAVPGAELEKKTLEALRLAKGDIALVAKAIAETAGAGETGQQKDETPEVWVRDAYSRLLLRHPTAAEMESAASKVRRDKQGWRTVLLELASRPDYLNY